MADGEAADLENLIKSPGWLRVRRHTEQEWIEHIDQHLGHATNDTDDLLALQKLRQVIAAKRAAEAVLAWPAHRLAQLKAQVATEADRASEPPSRRGTL